MILYMYIAPGQGQITSDDKFLSLYRAFVTSIIFVKFHHDTPIVKELEAKTFFWYINKCHNSVINYRNLPINNPSETLLVQVHVQNLNEIR